MAAIIGQCVGWGGYIGYPLSQILGYTSPNSPRPMPKFMVPREYEIFIYLFFLPFQLRFLCFHCTVSPAIAGN